MNPTIAMAALLNAVEIQDVEAFWQALDVLHAAAAETGKLPTPPERERILTDLDNTPALPPVSLLPTPLVVFGPIVSTDHLSPETCAMLDGWCRTIDLTRHDFSECPTLMGATDYGWLVYCVEETSGLPDDLAYCLNWARQHRHTHVLFDSDGGSVFAELPILGGPAALSCPRAAR